MVSLPAGGDGGGAGGATAATLRRPGTRRRSIVVAKLLERLGPRWAAGRRCLDLSAGCGLVAIVLAKLGADVTATDLEPNLPLLRENCGANGVPGVAVVEHRWGTPPAGALAAPFDVVVACDVMYVHELVADLVASLRALVSPDRGVAYVAHGRNRPAEPAFVAAAAAAGFAVSRVPSAELDPVFQTSDVDVLRLTRAPAGSCSAAPPPVAGARGEQAGRGGPGK
ncbi:METTL21A [Scenedesmus sp. PABB004]|nr:METTL21A [Scenedesmus sp. PABB004]